MNIGQPEPNIEDAQGLRFGIIAARFNQKLVDGLLHNCLKTLREASVDSDDIEVIRVPGSHELPYAVRMLAATGLYDCIIALGVVLEGETSHARIIDQNASSSFMRTMEDWEVPVINGVITATLEQAEERCLGAINRGREFGASALEMAELKLTLLRRLDEIYGVEDEDDDDDDDDWQDLYGKDDDEEEDSPWKS